jgi:hypothetical protein
LAELRGQQPSHVGARGLLSSLRGREDAPGGPCPQADVSRPQLTRRTSGMRRRRGDVVRFRRARNGRPTVSVSDGTLADVSRHRACFPRACIRVSTRRTWKCAD